MDGHVNHGVVVALVGPVGEVFHHAHEEIIHADVRMALAGDLGGFGDFAVEAQVLGDHAGAEQNQTEQDCCAESGGFSSHVVMITYRHVFLNYS